MIVGGAIEDEVIYDGNNRDVYVPVPVNEDAPLPDALGFERSEKLLADAVFVEGLDTELGRVTDDG